MFVGQMRMLELRSIGLAFDASVRNPPMMLRRRRAMQTLCDEEVVLGFRTRELVRAHNDMQTSGSVLDPGDCHACSLPGQVGKKVQWRGLPAQRNQESMVDGPESH